MEHAREELIELDAAERGGVIQGYTPIHSHVQLYLVQIISIVVLCFILGQLVKKWHQPRVIAEVRELGHLRMSVLGTLVADGTTRVTGNLRNLRNESLLFDIEIHLFLIDRSVKTMIT